jgi:hypothetical protein
MGREVKRVAMNFDWQLHKVWKGYLNPYYKECSDCKGSGYTKAHKRLSNLVSLLMISGEDSLRGRCHPYLDEAPLFQTQGETCGKDMAELTTGLAGRAPNFMGHDSIDRWNAEKKIIKAAGLPDNWGTCPSCQGDGKDLSMKKQYDEWKSEEPPKGEGYQIWETVSEGSPISPVFADPEKLADWMVENDESLTKNTTKEQWIKFISEGWAPSLIIKNGELKSGVESI